MEETKWWSKLLATSGVISVILLLSLISIDNASLVGRALNLVMNL